MPEVVLLNSAQTSDRRREFPGWPDWALNMMEVGSFLIDPGNAGEGVWPYIFTITVSDTPEHRAAFDLLPVPYSASNDFIDGSFSDVFVTPNQLSVTAVPGAPFSEWAPGLAIFAPASVQLALREQFEAEEEANKPIHFPSPNDFLRDARSNTSRSLVNLVPALGDPVGTDDADKLKRGLGTSKRRLFPNLFPSALEVVV